MALYCLFFIVNIASHINFHKVFLPKLVFNARILFSLWKSMHLVCTFIINLNHDMRFPTIWYVRPAYPQNNLCIHTVWSESLLSDRILYQIFVLIFINSSQKHCLSAFLKWNLYNPRQKSIIESCIRSHIFISWFTGIFFRPRVGEEGGGTKKINKKALKMTNFFIFSP